MIAYRLTGSRCRCASCGERFNSLSTFDRHRIGPWTDRGAHRRCLEPEELVRKGWQRNVGGFWIERRRPDGARRSGDPQRPAQGTRSEATRHALA